MLTVDFDRLDLQPGHTFLDLGCGNGRHSFEGAARGAHVIAADLDPAAPALTQEMLQGLDIDASQVTAGLGADALRLPFPDATFDRIVVSEVLEHIPDDASALSEIARVLKPGGRVAATVPRYWPERVCWTLSTEYHSNPGGHVRIYRTSQLLGRVRAAGFDVVGTHHAHALHSPYWWLKCAFGPNNEGAMLPRLYHRFLVWDIVKKPRTTRVLERALDPILGKSLVVYADLPAEARANARAA